MMVVDTSALVTIIVREPPAAACIKALESETDVLASAGTLAEALIVASRRHVSDQMAGLIDELDLEIIPVTLASARRIGKAYEKWGKGMHPAGLNFGDCFAYVLAKERSCPLLFIGNDFSQTDVESVL
jgi:ribonuclease VapC